MEITVKQMMQIEENGHQMGFSRKLMMENAGASVARHITEKYPDLSKKKVLVFAGLGNNGEEAFVVAGNLEELGGETLYIFVARPNKIKYAQARYNLQLCETRNYENRK